jgi:hypothetical protein
MTPCCLSPSLPLSLPLSVIGVIDFPISSRTSTVMSGPCHTCLAHLSALRNQTPTLDRVRLRAFSPPSTEYGYTSVHTRHRSNLSCLSSRLPTLPPPHCPSKLRFKWIMYWPSHSIRSGVENPRPFNWYSSYLIGPFLMPSSGNHLEPQKQDIST